MVRCDPFYRAMEKNQNFCKKNPETVKRILGHIILMEKLEQKVAQSAILKDSSHPIGAILSEGAARPLRALPSEADLDRALDLIIEKAGNKEMDGLAKIAVTNKEVTEIVRTIMPQKATRASTKAHTPKPADFGTAAANLQSVFDDGEITDEEIASTIGKIETLISTLETHKTSLIQRQATLKARSAATNTMDPTPQHEGVKA